MMRTTLTLDEDVAVRLKTLAERRKQPFRRVVNEALRAGLDVVAQPEPRAPEYHIEPVSLGARRLPSLDDIGEVLSIAEGEGHR